MADDCVRKVAEEIATGFFRWQEIDTAISKNLARSECAAAVERAIRMTIEATHDEENHGITKSQSQYREQRLKQVESLVCARILQALEAETR